MKTKAIMLVLNKMELPLFSLALGRISQTALVKIFIVRLLRLIQGMNYSRIAQQSCSWFNQISS